ncbi:MAG TPA: hypothetical protein P5228_09630 [Bacteroidales bacterium]|nr:hypothetical protein [Bacteroidales bacterium]
MGFYHHLPGTATRIVIPVFLLLGLWSCRKDQTPLAVKITEASEIWAVSGEYLPYHIEFICDEKVDHLRIEQFNPKYGTVVVLDTTPPGGIFTWYYLVPFWDDAAEATLTFTATSASFTNSVTRTVVVVNQEVPLTEVAGNAFHSNLSGKPNAFLLQGFQAVFYDQQSTQKPDFADNSTDSVHHNTLSREWVSPSGLLFCRLNDFNYPQATETSVQSAWSIAAKHVKISNLTNDDILIFGTATKARGAIRFSQIIDMDSTLDDRYMFNIKIVE